MKQWVGSSVHPPSHSNDFNYFFSDPGIFCHRDVKLKKCLVKFSGPDSVQFLVVMQKTEIIRVLVEDELTFFMRLGPGLAF